MNNKIDMIHYGFTGSFEDAASQYEALFPARVLSQYRDLYRVICENGELSAEISGKFRFGAESASAFPAVGDFVMIDRLSGESGNAIIHQVLPRKSVFIRKAAGTANEEQVVASNIDTVFICMSLNLDFNLRRLERYLAVSWDSGAVPVVVLTKADLCDDADSLLYEAVSVAVGAQVLVTTAMSEDGYLQIMDYMRTGETVAFTGSSGVGKSTLINRLMGEGMQETAGLRNDDKGRHTTTRRELILLENGCMVIDTPGMRELGLESANLSKSFADIDELTAMCRFSDCTHTKEPGCAVLGAVHRGDLSEERLESYRKLKREAKYEGLNSKQIETMKLNEMFREVGGMKNARKFAKKKR